jgi:hypothetical protein
VQAHFREKIHLGQSFFFQPPLSPCPLLSDGPDFREISEKSPVGKTSDLRRTFVGPQRAVGKTSLQACPIHPDLVPTRQTILCGFMEFVPHESESTNWGLMVKPVSVIVIHSEDLMMEAVLSPRRALSTGFHF